MIQTLISATAALMAAVSPMTSFTVIEDASDLPLLNPELKERKTLKLRLSNGLQALLISDPSADQSAAAVCVEAGSWSDPIEYPGMAHFCEHMLFMGTRKYPSENEFFTYVSDYAGQTNAFTAPNRTVYMFSSQTNGFLSLIDRFSRFFIDPLFNPANIAREMHAVDQEFAKNIENDGWREYMIFKETGNPDHPNRMFSTGNSETLGKIPQSALKKWHAEHYSSDRMHLAVYSSLPIEELQRTIVDLFSEVPRSTTPPTDGSGRLGSAEQIGSITFIKPIKNRQTLTLSWELPPELAQDETKSADLLAYALRRGQKYSLYEALKEEQLIDTMYVRVDELGGPEHRFFQITLELTEKGIQEIQTAVLRIFQAIAELQNKGVPAYLLQEKNTMAQLNYQYQGRQNPFDYISKLGDSIAEEDLGTYPRNTLLSTGYDAEKISAAASLLTPQSCTIALLAPPELAHVTLNRKEKWLGAEYAIQPIPETWMKSWSSAQPIDRIRPPAPNPFLPENLALISQGPSVPTLLAHDDLGMAYYVRSPEFGTPESVYQIHLLSPQLQPTPRSAVLASLYIDHLTDLLHPTLAAASAAGLSCSFDWDRSALQFTIAGYSEKAPLLLQEVIKQMPLDPPTPEQFSIYKARHEKAYLNAQKELAARQAKELLDSILNQDKAAKRQKLTELKTITYEEFLAFYQKLFETTYIQALFAGNLSMRQAQSAWLDLIHGLSRTPYPKEEHPQTKVLRLSNQGGPYQIAETTEAQGNAALLVIEQGGFTYEKRASQDILGSILKEAFFNELRTKQKTGYIAQSDASEIEERLFQHFLVQSNSHQPEELLFRFEQFIESFNDALSDNIPLERFETLKTSLIASLKTRFRNLGSKALLWDRLAFERDGNFDFVEHRVKALESLSYPDFLNQAHSFLSRKNRKRLAILVEGKLNTPFAYRSIELPQLPEIATYASRSENTSLRAGAAARSD